jgi:2-oxoglutarate ferredoxin oxidoreductase subunit delta
MANETLTAKPKKARKVRGRVEIDIQKCKGCELCAAVCKEDAMHLSKEINNKGYRYIVVINDNCTGCANCALVCPDAVIKVYRTVPRKRERELVAQITNVQSSISLTIDNPVTEDLQRMDYL